MERIYEMPALIWELKERCGYDKLYTIRGCLSLLEQLIDEYEEDFKEDKDKLRKIVDNPVYYVLDKRVSDMINRVYERGEQVGEYPLKLYIELNTRVELLVDLYNSPEVLKIKEHGRRTRHHDHRSPVEESRLKYSEAMLVSLRSMSSDYNEMASEDVEV